MLALRLPEEIEKRFTRLASITNRTKSYYAQEAIIRHLTDLEDIYLAETRLEDTKAGRSRTFTLDELEKDIGLDS